LGTLDQAGDVFIDERTYSTPSPFILNNDVLPNLDPSTNTLRFYDAFTGELVHTLNGVINLPAYTHDQSRFAVNTSLSIQVYSATSYDLISTLDGFSAPPSPWSPDDRHLLVKPHDALRRLGPVHIWNSSEVLSAPIYNATGNTTWSPDGSILAVSSDYTKIRLYDANSGELVETIRGFSPGGAYILEWRENYLIADSGNYQFARYFNVWDTEMHTFLYQDMIDLGDQYYLHEMILDISDISTVLRRIDLTTGETTQEIRADRLPLYRSPDRHWLVGADFSPDAIVPAQIYVYHSEPYELVTTLEGHCDMLRSIQWSPDSRYFASVGDPNNVIVWEVVEN
jgi:WD40 repeat protein